MPPVVIVRIRPAILLPGKLTKAVTNTASKYDHSCCDVFAQHLTAAKHVVQMKRSVVTAITIFSGGFVSSASMATDAARRLFQYGSVYAARFQRRESGISMLIEGGRAKDMPALLPHQILQYYRPSTEAIQIPDKSPRIESAPADRGQAPGPHAILRFCPSPSSHRGPRTASQAVRGLADGRRNWARVLSERGGARPSDSTQRAASRSWCISVSEA